MPKQSAPKLIVVIVFIASATISGIVSYKAVRWLLDPAPETEEVQAE